MLLGLAGCRTTPPNPPPVPKRDTGPKQPPPATPQTNYPPIEQREPTRVGRPPATPAPTDQRLPN